MNKKNNTADLFSEKRQNSQYLGRFIAIVRYIVFCYEKQVDDQVIYSKEHCLKQTSYGNRFEEYLTNQFVINYLRQYSGNCSLGNEKIEFEVRPELHTNFIKDTFSSIDRIDIAFTGIVKKKGDFSGIPKEEIYFAFECKRLNIIDIKGKVKSNIDEYLKDIKKFLEDRKYVHRFPSEGMIAFIEQHQGIESIIENIDKKLANHKTIQTTQNLEKVDLKNGFPFCRHSKHFKHSENGTEKEIYHLFFDYSQLITI